VTDTIDRPTNKPNRPGARNFLRNLRNKEVFGAVFPYQGIIVRVAIGGIRATRGRKQGQSGELGIQGPQWVKKRFLECPI
jgi:hypothetical protein